MLSIIGAQDAHGMRGDLAVGRGSFRNAFQLRAKAKEYQAQETELAEQIEEEKARSAKIDDLEEYVGTDEYVEEIARDKLGLVHENDII